MQDILEISQSFGTKIYISTTTINKYNTLNLNTICHT